MGEREWGAKAPRNNNLEGLQDQELKEPMTRSKKSYKPGARKVTTIKNNKNYNQE
jgi:hypothetical protein